MKLPYRILVLDDDEHALSGIVELLRDASCWSPPRRPTMPRRLLALGSRPAGVRRGCVASMASTSCASAAEHPEMAFIIVTGYDEPMMEFEAGRAWAKFVRKPIKSAEFLAAVGDALSKVRRQRRWTAQARRPGLPRVGARASRRRCGCVLRRAAPRGLERGRTSHVIRRRGGRHRSALRGGPCGAYRTSDGQSVVCGAALATDATPAARTWRAIVDRLTA